jgi:hypothetical protein
MRPVRRSRELCQPDTTGMTDAGAFSGFAPQSNELAGERLTCPAFCFVATGDLGPREEPRPKLLLRRDARVLVVHQAPDAGFFAEGEGEVVFGGAGFAVLAFFVVGAGGDDGHVASGRDGERF